MTINEIITYAASESHAFSLEADLSNNEQFGFACREMESVMKAYGIQVPLESDGSIRGDVLDALWDAMMDCRA